MRGFFTFIKGVPGKLGVGVADLGLTRTHEIPKQSVTGAGVRVRRSLAPTAPGYVKTGQTVVPASWLGTSGISLHGDIRGTRLVARDRG